MTFAADIARWTRLNQLARMACRADQCPECDDLLIHVGRVTRCESCGWKPDNTERRPS